MQLCVLRGVVPSGLAGSLIALAICAWASAAHAHHSPANFDTKQTVTAQGKVSQIKWFNPHVYVYMESTAKDGKTIEWEIECFPPIALHGFGWYKDTVRAGDTLTVTGSPARNPDEKQIYPSVIKLGDRTLFSMQDAQKKMLATAVPRPAAVSASSLAGIWTTPLSMPALMQMTFPDALKLTKDGQDALKRSDEKTGPATECIAAAAPLSMIVPDLKRISIDANSIYIEGEAEGVRRTIHLDAASHDSAIPSFQGHSIGRWEGKTLVVDTARFAYHGMGHGGGNGVAPNLPSSVQKHLVERFTLSEDAKSLSYRFEVSDPVFLTESRTGTIQFVYNPNAKFEAFPCSLENAKRFLKH